MRKEFDVHLLNDTGIAKAREVGEILSEALTELEAPANQQLTVDAHPVVDAETAKLAHAGLFARHVE